MEFQHSYGLPLRLDGDVGVYLRRSYLGMTQELLNDPNIRSGLQKMKNVQSYKEAMELIKKMKPGEALEFRVEKPWGLTLHVTRQLRKQKAKHGYTIYPEEDRGRVTITRKPKPIVLAFAAAPRKKEGEK